MVAVVEQMKQTETNGKLMKVEIAVDDWSDKLRMESGGGLEKPQNCCHEPDDSCEM